MPNFRNVGFVVGVLLQFIAVMMLIPLGISINYGDGDTIAFIWSILITIAAGTALMFLRRKGKDISIREGFAVVSLSWVSAALVGALPFFLSGAIPSFTDCLFESMSGFTTTGSSILGSHNTIESLPHGVLFWRSLTHWLGGMGIILLSLAILPMLGVGGMQLFRAEVPGPTKDKLTPRIKDTAKILWMVYLGISVLEMLLLWIGGMNLFDSACHTFGTMATGGFSTKSASIGFYDSRYIQYVIIIFMFIAGTNFALHYRFIFKGQINCFWSSREFRFYLLVVILFTILIMGYGLGFQPSAAIETCFRESLFQVVSLLTTTGYGTADWELWGAFPQVLLVLLMFVGGMAGSTGGGVKVIRVQVLLAQVKIELSRLIHPQAVNPLRIGGQVISAGIVSNVLAFLLAFGLILGASTAILAAMGIDMVTSFGAAVASLSNIGPGLGEVGPVDNYAWMPSAAKWLLIALMMLGRLEVFTVLVLFSRHFWRR
ncbi:MAG: potassium transporter TrkG [Candidatus Hatepunaea meridiana]|nr:potassium transporter TrkG [Candidatus Hatepunaea meridiana]